MCAHFCHRTNPHVQARRKAYLGNVLKSRFYRRWGWAGNSMEIQMWIQIMMTSLHDFTNMPFGPLFQFSILPDCYCWDTHFSRASEEWNRAPFAIPEPLLANFFQPLKNYINFYLMSYSSQARESPSHHEDPPLGPCFEPSSEPD